MAYPSSPHIKWNASSPDDSYGKERGATEASNGRHDGVHLQMTIFVHRYSKYFLVQRYEEKGREQRLR
jgi:hypothetical protein